MVTTTRQDPYRVFNFRLEFDGVLLAAFTEVSGLTAGITDRIDLRRVAGLQKYANVSLKRGIARDPLVRWWKDAVAGSPERRNVTIVLVNETGVPVSRWRVSNAWISKIEGPSLNATGNDVAMESIELAHEGITLE